MLGILELQMSAPDLLNASHVDLDPFVHLPGFRAPEGGVVVVGRVARQVGSFVRGRDHLGTPGEVRKRVLILAEVAYTLMRGADLFYLVLVGEAHAIDAGLPREPPGRDPDVVPVVDHEVVVALLQHAVVPGAVDFARHVRRQDRIVLTVNPPAVGRGAGFVD